MSKNRKKTYVVSLEQATHKDYWEQENSSSTSNNTECQFTQLDKHVKHTIRFPYLQLRGKSCEALIVEFNVQETSGSNSVTVTPSPFFVSYILDRDAGNKLIQTLYNVNLYNLAMLDYNQQKQVFPLHGINPDTWKPTVSCTLQPGQKGQFFLYILGDLFTTNRDIKMEWRDYLLVRLYLVNAVESGSGTFTLNSCQLRIRTRHSNDVHDDNSNIVHKWNYLDYLSVTSSQNTISSALTQNFIGHNVCTDIVLRNGTSVSNGQYRNFISLGRQAQLNYYDRSNEPILGGSFWTQMNLDYC